MSNEEYRWYLVSDHWLKLRALFMADPANLVCHRCGIPREMAKRWYGQFLNPHHLSYERIGHEQPGDLIALCLRCHRKEHGLPIGSLPNYVEYEPFIEVMRLREELERGPATPVHWPGAR